VKTNRIILLKLGVCASLVWFAQGADTQNSPFARAAANSFSGRFQAEFSCTGTKFSLPEAVTPAEPLPQAILTLRMVVGTEEASLGERLKAVRGLGRALTQNQIAILCVFLKMPPRSAEKDNPGLHGLKNDILNVLRDQTLPPARLTETMIGIYRDPAQDSVIRDYAIQHLVVWYERDAPDALGAKEKIRAVIQEAACEQSSIAGTALLGLHRLSERDAAFDQAEIDRLALRLAQSPDTPIATHITAIQVCAERGLKEALPAIEPLAQAPNCVPLRLSANAALARLGGAQPVGGLRRIEADEEEAAGGVSALALRQLQRKGQPY